jgi:putative ABC transport system permease protein
METVMRMREYLQRLLGTLGLRRRDADLEEELRAHLELAADEARRRGAADGGDAVRVAQLRAGGVSQAMDAVREQRGVRALDELGRDLRFGLRTLRRTPAFTAVALLTLALGIGANGAIFQLLDAVRNRTLAVQDPHQLAIVQLADMSRWKGRRSTPYPVLTNPLWERFRERQHVFSGVLAWSNMDLRLDRSVGAPLARALVVSGEFFDVLGVRPHIGRLLTSTDDRPGCGTPAVVVSHGFWQRHLGGRRDAVGSTLSLNGRAVQVIGVTQAGFSGVELGRSFDVAVPICSHPSIGGEPGWLTNGNMWWLTVMGRRAPGQSLDHVSAQLEVASQPLFEASLPASFPPDLARDYLSFRLSAVPGATGVSTLRRLYADPLVILQWATVLVLVIACTNLANLVLARASARQREFAVRLAVGGSWRRLVAQVMVENALLTAGGAFAGLACAMTLSRLLVGLLGSGFSLELALDARLMVFMAAIAFVTCLTFGLIPAWRASRVTAADSLKTGGRTLSGSSEGTSLRRVLVMTQVACSVVLLAGALLFVATLRNLLAVDTGFDADDVYVARIDLSQLTVNQARRTALIAEALDRIRDTQGVTSASEVRNVPLGGSANTMFVSPYSGDSSTTTAVRLNAIGSHYFETMGIRLLAGRNFDSRDASTAPRVAIANQSFTRRLGITEPLVGARFRRQSDVFEIVGVVPDSKYIALREDPVPIIFIPMTQTVDQRPFTDILVRSAMPLATLSPALTTSVAQLGSPINVDLKALNTTILDGLVRERLMATLSTVFGVLAALIAAVGLYGVMSYAVQRRTNEIGVRIALGATRHTILKMVLGEASRIVLIGLAIGAALSLAAGSSARSFVYGLQPHDARPIALACVVLGVTAIAASWLPARRAALLPPVAALREE